MATDITLNQIVAVRVGCKAGSQTAINVLHYRSTSLVAGASVTTLEIATRFSNLMNAPYKALMSVNASFAGVGCARIVPGPRTLEDLYVVHAGAGSTVGDVLPRQVCGVITKRTNFAGRKYRGRAYIPFPSETDNDVNGRPGNVYQTGLTTLANGICDEFTVTGALGTIVFKPVLFHKKDSTFDLVTSHVERDRWGTQRRRGDYGQPNVWP